VTAGGIGNRGDRAAYLARRLEQGLEAGNLYAIVVGKQQFYDHLRIGRRRKTHPVRTGQNRT
jgi:hypothetical protein